MSDVKNNTNLLRLFFAIEINEIWRNSIALLSDKLQATDSKHRAKWTRSENLHVTLRFIGSCEKNHVTQLIESVAEAVKLSPPVTLQAEQLRLFPSAQNPHVIALMIQLTRELFTLQQLIDKAIIRTGLPDKQQVFLPHITLARIKSPQGTIPLAERIVLPPLLVNSIALMNSEEKDGKRHYTALQRINLAATIQPQVAVGAIVIKENKVLLVKRKNAPNQGLWAIPGGKTMPGETLQQTAEREILEETGIKIRAKDPFYVFDLIERDSNHQLRLHYVIIDVLADYISGELSANDDAADARWFSKEDLNNFSLTESTRKLLLEKIFC